MKKKGILLYIFLGLFLSISMIYLFGRNINFKSLLNASVVVKEEDNVLLNAARNMIMDNIDKYNGEVSLSIGDLIKNKYITASDIKKDYNNDTRIIAIVNNNEIQDIYIKNNLFRNIYSCSDICYLNEDNYIAYNNSIYRIIKIDQNGDLYITDGITRKIKTDNMEKELRNIFNNEDNTIVTNVVSLSDSDINNTNIFIEDSLIVNTNTGYKLYNINTSSVEEINDIKNNKIIPVIVLRNDLSYEMGNGSKFNPYILSK